MQVDNRLDAVPNSIVAPSLLFGELEVRRSNQAKEKLPDYPAPGQALAEKAAPKTGAAPAAQ